MKAPITERQLAQMIEQAKEIPTTTMSRQGYMLNVRLVAHDSEGRQAASAIGTAVLGRRLPVEKRTAETALLMARQWATKRLREALIEDRPIIPVHDYLPTKRKSHFQHISHV